MADLTGLMSGIGSLGQGFLQGYQAERKFQEDRRQSSLDKALKDKMLKMQMLQQGIKESPAGELGLTPEKQQEQALGLQEKEANIGLLKQKALGKEEDPVTGLLKLERLKKLREDEKGQKLPPGTVMQVSEAQALPSTNEDVLASIEANKDLFGPIAGRIGAINPYNENVQTLDSQLRAASQMFGRYMEGGVLRKEDEEKYRKMYPQLSDTPEVARNKLMVVDRLLKKKMTQDVSSLGQSGYNVGAFQEQSIPKLPGVLNDKKETKVIGGKTYRKVPGGWEPM